MRPSNELRANGTATLAGLVALGLVLGTFGLTGLTGPGLGPERSNAPAFGSAGVNPIPQNCSQTVLAGLTATPAKVGATPLEVLLFTAVATNACGAPLAQDAVFAWWLSSVSLGTLNSSVGRTVAYTACLAPMGGILHLKATSGTVTLYSNSSISVSAQSSSGPDSPVPLGGFPGEAGSASGPGVSWAGVGIMAALLVGAGLVLVAGRRNRK